MKLTHKRRDLVALCAATLVAAALVHPGTAFAVVPVVKTVPWVASQPLVPHDTFAGKSIRLKGTADVQGANIQYIWDFGDGSAPAVGTVTNRYAIEASHVYNGSVGTVFTSRLTVRDTSTGEAASKPYYVQMRAKTLGVEANIAIDEGLWYLHKAQRRIAVSGVELGDWTNLLGYYGLSAANLNAFEVNGHLQNGPAESPYTETVARAMRQLFNFLHTNAIATQTNGLGTFNPDSNGNGIGVSVNQAYEFYQGGMFIDAIVSSGTPLAIATTGPANVIGRSYRDIVQDMVDFYGYCQYDGSPFGGGWRYNCNEFPDNSSAQWGAIGLIAAERNFGVIVPAIVKNWNRWWLRYTQNPAGYFGYTDSSYLPWGPYATTPSGMVQMALDGIGRDSAVGPNDPSWNKAETFIRDNFGNGGTYATNIKSYYYGLFSFTKAMLLHDRNGIAEPITMLRSSTPGVAPIDWYAAELAKGDPTDGVARTLINGQNSSGTWTGHDADGSQMPFETAWAIMMLNRTVFSSGVPVAVAKALPNPAVAGQQVQLDGSDSYHQDAGRTIVSWQWDFDQNGTFDASGPFAQRSFAALGDYPVTLQVCDNGAPATCSSTIVTVRVTTPPIAPTANAGGPYAFCPAAVPWFLDARGSVNPDEGLSEPGRPADTITNWEWDLDGDGVFVDAAGPVPDVTAWFAARAVGSYLVQVRVTDRTALSFPSSGMGNLGDTDSAVVVVRAATDPACSCVSNLSARAKSGKIQLVWAAQPGVDHYNVYRATASGGPYLKIGATSSSYATYLDGTVFNGTTYHYVVRAAGLADDEQCQSNQSSARATTR